MVKERHLTIRGTKRKVFGIRIGGGGNGWRSVLIVGRGDNGWQVAFQPLMEEEELRRSERKKESKGGK